MFPFSSLISLAGQGIGYIMSAVNNRKQQRAADKEAARQIAVQEAKGNENILSRSENRQAIAEFDRKSEEQVRKANNVATITGATPEYALAVQSAVSNARADLVGEMASGASTRKDAVDDEIENIRRKQAEGDMERLTSRQTSYANLISNASSAFGNLLSGYKSPGETSGASEGVDDIDGNSEKNSTTTPPHAKKLEEKNIL